MYEIKSSQIDIYMKNKKLILLVINWIGSKHKEHLTHNTVYTK